MNIRSSCAGGCERQVLKKLGECRKCRRQRVRAGMKRLARLERSKRAVKFHLRRAGETRRKRS